jgi:hypothetical protein
MSFDAELEVEDVFLILGRGLAVIPVAFRSILPADRYQPFDDKVVVIKPDGTRTEFDAKFLIEHFSLTSGSRYSLVALLPSASRVDVPVGSKLAIEERALTLIRSKVIVQ